MLSLLDSNNNILYTLQTVLRNDQDAGYNLEVVGSPYSSIWTAVGDKMPKAQQVEFVAIVNANSASERSAILSQIADYARDTRSLLFNGATRPVAGVSQIVMTPIGHQATRLTLRFAPTSAYWTRDGQSLEVV